MEVQVSKWYRRGEYKFLYVRDIKDDVATTITITHNSHYIYDRAYSSWNVKDIQELFVEMTEEEIELYKPKMLLPIKEKL
jgi:hypothetical protein